jgi:hypothetical protein
MDTLIPHRVAVYAAPAPGSAWWERGSQWLGRCAFRQCSLPQPAIDGMAAGVQSTLTAEPRRYGWHATFKAPWRMSSGVSVQSLRAALASICADHRAFDVAGLQVARLGGFLALCPAQAPAALGPLAEDCVRRLQALAAPLSEQELARRRRKPLTAEEDALMLTWGYPWVLHKFRFHFSLTGPLKDAPIETVEQIRQAAVTHFAGLPPLRLAHLSLFIEPAQGDDFVLVEQMALVS